ncbi:dicarboxylate/amino acid:cation symporter [Lamprobacter modestohalophilus]|uniref:dicarboxylate/amino acid:cation symporter n=1 Tax=Lamprobacter modestohalophilus TaxID=1064514 RepID=UPI002ADEEC7C|nr:dicarboxylate/amino acid:cation symporter [Lamprobacter modestohalophilus]MEA1049447.1 dicarboxylate/amino acid:cation symporter [Lamprobacter modestohalophilus]
MTWRSLYSTPTGLALGVLLALLWPAGAVWVSWLGDIFLSLLRVLILPLILVSIYAALARGVDLARLGGRTLGFYLLTSAFAAVSGSLLGLWFSRGVAPGLLDLEPMANGGVVFGAGFSLEQLITNLVPSNLFASLAEGNILHIVVLAIFAALAARGLQPEPRVLLADGADALNALLMRMLAALLGLAPIGIAALVYASLAGMDWAGVLALQPFVWAVTLAAVLHALLFLPALLWLGSGRHPWRFFIQVRAALATALATASSAATYPVSKQSLEQNAGVSSSTTSFTLPLGATLNMDGSALYQSILLLFMAQLAGAEVSLWQALMIVLLTMASSAGTAGIPGGGIAMMAFMLDLLGLPQTYLALYLVVDRFFDYPITALNVWGDLVVAALVGCNSETAARAQSPQ